MWGKQGHEELRGQTCSGSEGAGAQQLRLRGRSEQESSRDALLRAGTGRGIGCGRGEGEEQGALCLARRWLFWVRRVKVQAAGWGKKKTKM